MNRKPENIYEATACAHPNIALVKYWGNVDSELRLPSNGSISMNLQELVTKTHICFSPEYEYDTLTVDETPLSGDALIRVSLFLDLFRQIAGIELYAHVESIQNFPQSTGLASSASAFAALALAAADALSLNLEEAELSRLARHGSGSACRSIPGGFVEWYPGDSDMNSYAVSIAPADHWNLVDCIAIVTEKAKSTGSSDGHRLAASSMLQDIRITDAPRRLALCRQAILERDFEALAKISELDSNLMHAVMMTSEPSLFYWEPTSLTIMKSVMDWRKSGLPVFYTIDAGPNVHVITDTAYASNIKSKIEQIPGVIYGLCSIPGQEASIDQKNETDAN